MKLDVMCDGMWWWYALLLQSCVFLVDALSVLTVVAAGSQDETLRRNLTETILRLGNHYWEELALVSRHIPIPIIGGEVVLE